MLPWRHWACTTAPTIQRYIINAQYVELKGCSRNLIRSKKGSGKWIIIKKIIFIFFILSVGVKPREKDIGRKFSQFILDRADYIKQHVVALFNVRTAEEREYLCYCGKHNTYSYNYNLLFSLFPLFVLTKVFPLDCCCMRSCAPPTSTFILVIMIEC